MVTLPGGSMDCYVDGELVAHHEHGAPAYERAHYEEALEGKGWFGDSDIAAAAAANLELLGTIGGSL